MSLTFDVTIGSCAFTALSDEQLRVLATEVAKIVSKEMQAAWLEAFNQVELRSTPTIGSWHHD